MNMIKTAVLLAGMRYTGLRALGGKRRQIGRLEGLHAFLLDGFEQHTFETDELGVGQQLGPAWSRQRNRQFQLD